MRRLNEVMDLKFSLLIFRQFHGVVTRSQKKNVYVTDHDVFAVLDASLRARHPLTRLHKVHFCYFCIH